MQRGRILAALAAVILPAAIMGFAGCVTPVRSMPGKTTLASDRVSLPTRTVEGFRCLFIEVNINGHGPFRLLVDTGATPLAIAPWVADAAGLKPYAGGTVAVVGATGKTQTGYVAPVARLESGGFKAEQLWAYLMSSADAENFRAFGGMDGFCGLHVFADVVLEIDFPKRQVDVVRPGTVHYPETAGVRHEDGVVVLELGGKSMRATLDTGFEGTLELPLDLASLRYPAAKRGGQSVTMGGFGEIEASQVDGEVRLGPVSWSNPPVTNGLGLIGSRALQTWKVVVDQHERQIFFLGTSLHRFWPTQILRATGAGYLADYEGTTLRLRAVIPGTAAAFAGLKPGDVIVTINGVVAADFVTGHAPDAERTDVVRHLRVQRGGQELDLIMDLSRPSSRP
jgi:predicted aspartyl protease